MAVIFGDEVDVDRVLHNNITDRTTSTDKHDYVHEA